MKVLILAGGDLHVTQRLIEQLADATLIIAADSGIRHAKSLAITPNLLVGDFDSISNEDREYYKNIPIVQHQPEKDDLDLELAIQEAKQKCLKNQANEHELILVGATGSRLDQSLAAITIAARHKENFSSVKLYTGKQEIEILHTSDAVNISNENNPKTFSLISLVEKSILSIQDAKYPLNHAILRFGTGLGISNETLATQTTEITIHSGLCVLVIELENQ